MKSALRSGEKSRLQTIRLILAAVKQSEMDTRQELSDQDVVAVLTKMQKQRRESISQFAKANRQDLVARETLELQFIEKYLPDALTEEEVGKLITKALSESGARGIKDMGRVMAILKPRLLGRTDMGAVSARVKSMLNA